MGLLIPLTFNLIVCKHNTKKYSYFAIYVGFDTYTDMETDSNVIYIELLKLS